jgi:uncharacterized protein YjbJ (UPF0337 family)
LVQKYDCFLLYKLPKKEKLKMDATTDILHGKWHELKGLVRQQWGKLTDDDMTQLSGKTEELAGILQQRYGYGKAQANTEIDKWLTAHDKSVK